MPRIRLFLLAMFFLTLTARVHAAEKSWVGKKIMTKEGRIALRVVDDNDQWKNVGEVTDFVVTVEKEDGHWIKIRSRGIAGWIDRNDAVLLEDAIEYFTDRILCKGQDAYAYLNRGIAWKEKGEYDLAIKDYNEAIRLKPKEAIPYIARGNIWTIKQDYDKAIQHYDEAIRIDPKDALTFYNRGTAW